MATKIGNRNFPETLQEILDDKKEFAGAFLKFLKKSLAAEMLEFYYMHAGNVPPQKLFETFIEPGSPREINISGTLRARMEALAAQGDWSKPNWRPHLDEASAECFNLMSQNFLLRFKKSEFFAKAVEKTMPAAVKKVAPGVMKAITKGSMVNMKFATDKRTLICVQITSMAGYLEKVSNNNAGNLKRQAKALFETICKTHSESWKYSDWQKAVMKHA